MLISRDELSKFINHIILGGIIEFEDRYIYLDGNFNVKALLKHNKINLLGEDAEKQFDLIDEKEVINIIGFSDPKYYYEIIHYNSLTFNNLIRLIVNNKNSFLKLL